MALSPQEQQELAELEELEALEREEAQSSGRSPAISRDPEPGLKAGSFSPTSAARMAADMLGFDTAAAGRGAVNSTTFGYGVDGKQIASDMKRSPVSSMAGTVAGAAAVGAPIGAATGTGMLANAASGAAQGALSNPGEKGTMGDRILNGGIGAFLGLLGSGLGKLASKGAKTDKMLGLVKDEAKLYDESVNRINDGVNALNEKIIEPNDQKLRALLKGKTSTLDLDQYRELAPDMVNEIELASPRAYKKEVLPGTSTRHYTPEATAIPQPDVVVPAQEGGTFSREPVYQTVRTPNPNRIAGGPEFLEERVMVPGSDRVNVASVPEQRIPQAPIMQPGQPTSQAVQPLTKQVPVGHDVDGESILNLRQRLGQEGYKTKKALDGPTLVKNEQYKQATDSLRPHITGMAPEADDLFKSSSEALTLRDILSSKLSKPISGLTTSADDNLAILSKIDKLAGTELRGFGEDVATAQDLIPKWSNLAKPLAAPNEIRKAAIRGAAKAGSALEELPEGTNPALINVLMRGKQR